jgi:DNA-binding transcriptional ArsR family regulator
MSTKTPPASLKSAIYEQIARIGQATASPNRLELLDLLSQGARTVEALAHQTGQSVATTSHHLQVLRRARLVEARKAGLYVTYRLADLEVGSSFFNCEVWRSFGWQKSSTLRASTWRSAARWNPWTTTSSCAVFATVRSR